VTQDHIPVRKLIWVSVFGIAFAFVESSVVAYLRALYYPDGFTFPLRVITQQHLAIELAREAATIMMLVAVGILAGGKAWQKFGYFLVAFGVWDIFYYLWLKAILNWPGSFVDWDILFLIPLPWIGPVIAPVLVASLMTVCGLLIVVRVATGVCFRPVLLSWLSGLAATVLLLYSFMSDVGAGMRGQNPLSYRYELLVIALVLYGLGFAFACKPQRELRSGR
jgi:hypothetical protein